MENRWDRNALHVLPALRDPHMRRAYRYLEGNHDEQMAQAHALNASPDCKNMRQVLQGFLCARDISLEGIALQLELEAEVVKLFEALFFNVRERGDGFRASVMFPETRIGAVVEAEKDFDDLERTLMRVGRERGWKDVARARGKHGKSWPRASPTGDHSSPPPNGCAPPSGGSSTCARGAAGCCGRRRSLPGADGKFRRRRVYS
jgi:hypothetical protein